MDLDRLRRRARRKDRRQHAELQLAGCIHLLPQPRQACPHLIAQSLLFQAGADTGAKQRRIERLRQVVLGTELDAADDAFNLAERRNHDHGNVAQLGARRLHALQYLVPVHVGHHDVEENEVKPLRLEEIECFTPVGRCRQIGVALARQASCKRVAIVVVVIDDEQGRTIGAHEPALSPSSLIFARRRGNSTGFVSKSSQPADSAFSRSPAMACAVRAITGICRVSGVDLI